MSEPGLPPSTESSTDGPDAQRSATGDGASAAGSDDPLSRQADPARFDVDLVLETPDLDPPLAGWLEPALQRIAALAGVSGGVTLVIVDDAAMIRLHDEYHHDPTTTDVLTFDLSDSPAPPRSLPSSDASPQPPAVEGDVVICLDEARRQSASHGHETQLEVLLYAVHGLLHLMGMDDLDPDDAQRMHRREDELLVQAGFGPVYAKET